jgi:hypothetical protein
MKKKHLKILSIFLILASLVIFFLFNFAGLKETLTYKEVIVAKKDIQKYQTIKKEDVQVIKIDETAKIKNDIRDINEIVGKMAANFIPENAPFHKYYLTEDIFKVGEGEKVFAVPNDWLFGIPYSLRRGDTITVYPVSSDKDNNKTIKKDDGAADNDKLINNKEFEDIKNKVEPLMRITVIYVKDSTNREVVNVVKESRLDASSKVASIEIIINDEQLNTLNEYRNNGYKFLVLYDEEG